MANPFDDPDGSFLVLTNSELQRSLWPAAFDVPAGWSRSFGPADLPSALAHVEAEWTDIRPAGLSASA
jgi:MbtH protein